MNNPSSPPKPPFYTSPELAAAREKISEYFSDKPDGAMISWLEMERDIGIPMRSMHRTGELDGRSLVRQALQKMKRPYETVHGSGIRLSAAATAVTILGGAISKVANATKRAKKVHANLQERHMKELSTYDRERMTRAAGMFATLDLLRKEQIPPKALK